MQVDPVVPSSVLLIRLVSITSIVNILIFRSLRKGGLFLEPNRRMLRRGPEQRLEFIEFRLFWEGVVNRSDLVGRFGVSVPQASNDLTAYRQLAPENVIYDLSGKRYVPATTF